AGRFRWRPPGARVPGKVGIAAFEFPSGTLVLTEASSKKRASLHVVRGAAALAAHDAGGLEVLDADLSAFSAALTRESHTLRRAGAAHRLRRERDQLLRALPDGRRAARRPVAVAAAEERLAPEPRRAGRG